MKYAAGFHARRPIFPVGPDLPQAYQQRLRAVLEASIPELVRRLLGQ